MGHDPTTNPLLITDDCTGVCADGVMLSVGRMSGMVRKGVTQRSRRGEVGLESRVLLAGHWISLHLLMNHLITDGGATLSLCRLREVCPKWGLLSGF